MMPLAKYFFFLMEWVTNCLTILFFDLIKISKLLRFHGENGEKPERGPLQWILYRNSTKGRTLHFKIQLVEGHGILKYN